jgi:excisionase family DNA binding protein
MEKYLTIEELSRILQVKKHYIYALTSQRKIPFLKLGRFLRFERDKIEEWLKDKAQKPEDIEKIKASVF